MFGLHWPSCSREDENARLQLIYNDNNVNDDIQQTRQIILQGNALKPLLRGALKRIAETCNQAKKYEVVSTQHKKMEKSVFNLLPTEQEKIITVKRSIFHC